jgi:hypothetical protein
MKFLSYSFLVFLILVSCQSNKIQDEKSILGIWRLSESVDHSLSSANKDPLLEEAQKLEEGKDGHVLSLFSDKSFTELKGNGEYFYGNWSWLEKDQKLQLKYSDRKIVYDVVTNFTDTNAVVLQLKNPRKEYPSEDWSYGSPFLAASILAFLAFILVRWVLKDFKKDT